jgi:hypothetical protein
MTKDIRKLGIEGKYLKIIKAICDKPTASIILNGEKLKPFPLKSGMRQGCPLSPIQHSTGIPRQSNYAEERIKVILIDKISPFADNMILYLKTQRTLLKSS